MQPNGKHEKPLPDASAVFETILDHIAEEEAENEVSTETDRCWAHNLRQQMETHIAALRRQLTPVRPVVRRPPPISSEIRALDRDGLLARLEALRQAEHVRYAHQDLTGLSDDDLRHMLALLVASPDRQKGSNAV